MTDIANFVIPVLLDTMEEGYAAIAADKSLNKTKEEIDLRLARADDFDSVSESDYNYSLTAGLQATAPWVFDPIKEPLAVLFAGWFPGTIENNIDYVRIDSGQTKIREYPGMMIVTGIDGGPWVAPDPTFKLQSKTFKINVAAIEAASAARTFPFVLLYMPK